jgi:hypothetical protein
MHDLFEHVPDVHEVTRRYTTAQRCSGRGLECAPVKAVRNANMARASCRRRSCGGTRAASGLIPRLGQVAVLFTVVAANADHFVHQSPAPVSLEMQEQVDRVRDVVAD